MAAFGDGSNVPTGKLRKRRVALFCHRVRELIPAKVLHFTHIPGATDPADALSEHWGHQATWPQLQALSLWKGDAAALLKEVKTTCLDGALFGHLGSDEDFHARTNGETKNARLTSRQVFADRT